MTMTQLLARRHSGPFFIVPIAAVIFLLFGIGPNYELGLLLCVVLIGGVFLLWRPEEPQILLFLFLFQWLQIETSTALVNLRGVSLENYPAVNYASMLASIGLLSLAIGIRIGAGPQQASYLTMIRDSIQRIPAKRWLKIHLIMICVSSLSIVLARLIPGLSQPLLALADMRWGTFLIFTIVTFARPRGPRHIWLMLFGLEFLLSLGGFFSSFKTVFLFTLIAITMVGTRITPRQIVAGLFVAVLTLVLGLYWTAIKPEYRAFVSGGEATQAVVVGYDEALQELVELVGQVDSGQLEKAANNLADRFADLDVFAAVVDYVPSAREHEGGKLWLDAISRPLMPRILFPDKAVIDESALTNYYTGLNIAGFAEGTQISMGYIAESYIDFGEIGMMVPIFLVGFFIGLSYRWLLRHPAGIGLIGCGLASSTFIQFNSISVSSAKLVGGVVVSLLVAFIILNFVIPRYVAQLYGTRLPR